MPVSFPPLNGENPKILVLGSMPGKDSLRLNQYYANKRNCFWKIMFRYFDTSFSENYEARKSLIRQNGIALWDTIASCERENSSLDSDITNVTPNSIAWFLEKHLTICAVFTNGKKSYKIFKECFPLVRIPCKAMPSTSPANTRTNFENQYSIWKAALDEFRI